MHPATPSTRKYRDGVNISIYPVKGIERNTQDIMTRIRDQLPPELQLEVLSSVPDRITLNRVLTAAKRNDPGYAVLIEREANRKLPERRYREVFIEDIDTYGGGPRDITNISVIIGPDDVNIFPKLGNLNHVNFLLDASADPDKQRDVTQYIAAFMGTRKSIPKDFYVSFVGATPMHDTDSKTDDLLSYQGDVLFAIIIRNGEWYHHSVPEKTVMVLRSYLASVFPGGMQEFDESSVKPLNVRVAMYISTVLGYRLEDVIYIAGTGELGKMGIRTILEKDANKGKITRPDYKGWGGKKEDKYIPTKAVKDHLGWLMDSIVVKNTRRARNIQFRSRHERNLPTKAEMANDFKNSLTISIDYIVWMLSPSHVWSYIDTVPMKVET